MARVEVYIRETEIENDNGFEQEAVSATCSVCGHETESFGTHEASRRRCLVMMRKECPMARHNFYVEVPDFHVDDVEP